MHLQLGGLQRTSPLLTFSCGARPSLSLRNIKAIKTLLLMVGTWIFLRISRGDDKIKRSSKDVREEKIPLEILKKRYSKGEIDAAKFARGKKDLES